MRLIESPSSGCPCGGQPSDRRELGSTVYVGDGVWDARACRNVGIPFVGIGTGIRATRLSAEGAVCVFPDFSDTDLFLSSVYEDPNAARRPLQRNRPSRSGCNPRLPRAESLSLSR